MIKNKGRWIVAAISLFLVGSVLFVGGMTMLGWNFRKLSTVKLVTNTHTIEQEFKGISVVTDSADVEFVASDKASVICTEQKKFPHSVVVEDGILVIKVNSDKKWYDEIGINFTTPKITVNIPKGEYEALFAEVSTGDVVLPDDFTFRKVEIDGSTGDVECGSTLGDAKIFVSTGDIILNNTTANNLDLSVSTGDIKLADITCKTLNLSLSTGDVKLDGVECENLSSKGRTGNVFLENVIAAKTLKVKNTTGGVKLKDCDAGEIYITVTTGDVKGNLLSQKAFVTKAGTGRIDVPKTVTGGRCEITTTTGDIKITVTEK